MWVYSRDASVRQEPPGLKMTEKTFTAEAMSY